MVNGKIERERDIQIVRVRESKTYPPYTHTNKKSNKRNNLTKEWER